jgi:phospholysine phosphohistidine inorganic pyrophosphate phosphatase
MGNDEDTSWTKSIKGFLVDITGVLYDSGGQAIPGSIEAIRR